MSKSKQLESSNESDIEALDDEDLFQDIDILQNHGINVADIKKLKAAGIFTIKAIQMNTRKKMVAIKGLSEAKVDKIREAVNKISSVLKFLTAKDIIIKRKKIFKISTGSEELDKILGGGVESMAITEAYGEHRCGKTQICYTLSITCQLKNSNSSGGKALFIDTENTFRPNRLKQIASRFELDEEIALENVFYVRAYTSEHQYEIIDNASAKLYEEPGSFKLIIVDSVMALFRVDFTGRAELADRQQKLAQFLSRLQRLSEEFNLAVFLTNQMTADPGANLSFQADPKKPIGGNIIAHSSTTRIALRKGRGEQRIAKIVDSPDMPENEAVFALSEGGIIDIKE